MEDCKTCKYKRDLKFFTFCNNRESKLYAEEIRQDYSYEKWEEKENGNKTLYK